MGKKSFKEINPALQFISSSYADAIDNTDNDDYTHNTDTTYSAPITHNAEVPPDNADFAAGKSASTTPNTYNTDNTPNTHITPMVDIAHNTHNADNTPNAYIPDNVDNAHNTTNTLNTPNADNTRNTDIAHYTDNADITEAAPTPERKTKRLNLLLQPSLLRDISKIAHMRRRSVNDLIGTVLREYADANPELIADYDRVFSDER